MVKILDILTGSYPIRTFFLAYGITSVSDRLLPRDECTVGSVGDWNPIFKSHPLCMQIGGVGLIPNQHHMISKFFLLD